MNRFAAAAILLAAIPWLAACGGNAFVPPTAATASALPSPTPTMVPAQPSPTATAPALPTPTAVQPTATPIPRPPPAPPTGTLVPTPPATPSPAPTATRTAAPAASPTATATPFVGKPGKAIIPASKDNTLYQSMTGATSNGKGEGLFVGNTNNGESRRSLVMFDLAGKVPAGAKVKSVTLQMHVSRTQTGAQKVLLHRVLAAWGEGTSDASANEGSGASAQPGDATWVHRTFDTAKWNRPGGDFADRLSAPTGVDQIGNYIWTSSEMVDDVEGWLADPATNFGWILIGNESGTQTTKRFDSREHPAEGNRPMLVVAFLAP